MENLYEKDDLLNMPVQCFLFNSTKTTFPVKKHWHYYMEVLYVLEGTASIHMNQEHYTVTPGQMILLPPKSVHSIDSIENERIMMYGLKLDISRMNISSFYSPKLRSIFRCAEAQNMKNIFSKEETVQMGVVKAMESCLNEMRTQNYGFDSCLRAHIYCLLVEIVRVWLQEGFNIEQQAFTEDDSYDLYNITEYIDENLSKNLHVADIAVKCKMSYSYFARKFQDAYGKNCKDYIEEMRLYKVEELLRYTDFDLTYISQETGFSDCSHLIHQFKKLKGLTPKQYRMQLKKETVSSN